MAKRQETTNREKRAVYNESEAMQTFLCSSDGITFLIDKAKEAKLHAARGARTKMGPGDILDEIIDFYATWAFNCPIRKNHKLSQYEIIRKIEDHCAKPEVKRFFRLSIYRLSAAGANGSVQRGPMEDEEINSIEFVKARAEEMRRIEESIETGRKRTMLFQRLPFHKRRRTRSFHPRKPPRVGGLATWLAKRFRMLRIFGTALPAERFAKSDSFIYKSFKRGFLFHETHKQAHVFRRDNFNLQGEWLDAGNYAVLVSMGYVPEELELVGRLDAPISVLGDVDLGSGVYETGRDAKSEVVRAEETAEEFIGAALAAEEAPPTPKIRFVFLETGGCFEKGKIFVDRRCLMDLWQKMVLKGFVPVSISEILRGGMERTCFVFPFDYVSTRFFREYEEARAAPLVDKHRRTPPGKRAQCEQAVLPFEPQPGGALFFFEAPKGRIERCADVLSGRRRIGAVLRAMFCYSAGRVRGICCIERGHGPGGLVVQGAAGTRPVEIVLLPEGRRTCRGIPGPGAAKKGDS